MSTRAYVWKTLLSSVIFKHGKGHNSLKKPAKVISPCQTVALVMANEYVKFEADTSSTLMKLCTRLKSVAVADAHGHTLRHT